MARVLLQTEKVSFFLTTKKSCGNSLTLSSGLIQFLSLELGTVFISIEGSCFFLLLDLIHPKENSNRCKNRKKHGFLELQYYKESHDGL